MRMDEVEVLSRQRTVPTLTHLAGAPELHEQVGAAHPLGGTRRRCQPRGSRIAWTMLSASRPSERILPVFFGDSTEYGIMVYLHEASRAYARIVL